MLQFRSEQQQNRLQTTSIGECIICSSGIHGNLCSRKQVASFYFLGIAGRWSAFVRRGLYFCRSTVFRSDEPRATVQGLARERLLISPPAVQDSARQCIQQSCSTFVQRPSNFHFAEWLILSCPALVRCSRESIISNSHEQMYFWRLLSI